MKDNGPDWACNLGGCLGACVIAAIIVGAGIGITNMRKEALREAAGRAVPADSGRSTRPVQWAKVHSDRQKEIAQQQQEQQAITGDNQEVVQSISKPWPFLADAIPRESEENWFEVTEIPPVGVYSYRAPAGFIAMEAEIRGDKVFINLRRK